MTVGCYPHLMMATSSGRLYESRGYKLF